MFIVIAGQFLDCEPNTAPVFLTDDPVKALKVARGTLKRNKGTANVVVYQIMVNEDYVPFDSFGTDDRPSKTVMFVSWFGFGESDVVEKFYNNFSQFSEIK